MTLGAIELTKLLGIGRLEIECRGWPLLADSSLDSKLGLPTGYEPRLILV